MSNWKLPAKNPWLPDASFCGPPAPPPRRAGWGAAAPLAAGDPGWFDRPMRWAQLNSTEDDAAEMDIGFWMDYFKRIHADALCITAGGVVAFYPTKIKYHRPSAWLADAVRTTSAACWRAARSWAWWWWGGPTRTPPTTTSTATIPTGSRWTPRATGAAIGKARRCG